MAAAIMDAASTFEWNTGVTPLTSVEFLICAHVGYFLTAFGLRMYMNRTSAKVAYLPALTRAHNVLMCTITACLLGLLGYAASEEQRFTSFDALMCHRPGANVGLLPLATYLFYLSKILTFVDTMLLIGGRKRVAWLHVVHHSLTMTTVWSGVNAGMPTEVVNMGLNCFVHVLLYLYFAFPVRSLRPLVTFTQLVQFAAGLASTSYNVLQRTAGDRATCDGTLFGELHGLAVYALFLGLFGHFFYARYVRAAAGDKPDDVDMGPCGCGENPCGELAPVEVPSKLLRTSSTLAVEVLSKALVCGVVGLLVTAYMPWWMLPVGVFITGMAFSWFYIIGQDCSLDIFFPSKLANTVVGTIILLPLLRPLDDARRTLQAKSAPSSSTSTSQLLVFAFVGGAVAACTSQPDGWSSLVKYWLLPFLVMHLNLRSFSQSKAGSHSFNLLFPELEHITDETAAGKQQPPQPKAAADDGAGSGSDSPAEGAAADADAAPFGEPVSLSSLLHRVPIYHMSKAAEEVQAVAASQKRAMNAAVPSTDPETQSSVTNIIDRLWAVLPSRRVSRDMLFWKRRDTALWAVAALIVGMVGVQQVRDYAWLPLLVLVPFLGPKSRAARMVGEWQTLLQDSPSVQQVPLAALMVSFLRTINWPMGIYITLVHVGAAYGVQAMPSCKWQTLVFAFWLWPFSGIGITAGVHRLWAHRSYKASPQLRSLLMIMNSVANQGTIFHWARDHRVHHKYSETDADPHNAKRGFFFAHIGWLYVKKNQKVIDAGRAMKFEDLLSDGPVMLQKQLDPFWNLFWCYFAPALVAHVAWDEGLWLGFLVPGVLRYCVVLHFTWLVNSAAHLWGDHPYDEHSNPAENGFVSIAAVGEGWHNWHHAYPYDYAASELGVSYQFNPTKMFIDFFAAIGHVTDRKRATNQWSRKMARQAGEGEAIESLRGPPMFKVRHVDYTSPAKKRTE